MPQTYRFEHALIGGAWQHQVVMSVDATGSIESVSSVAGGESWDGPVGNEEGPGADGDAAPPRLIRGWAIPGLCNVHSHAFQRGLVGRAERTGTDSFWQWREVMYAYVAKLTPQTVEATAAQLFVELLRGGFTSVGEFHYLHHQAGGKRYADPAEMSRRVIEAARHAGINLVHIPVVYHQGGFDGRPLEPPQRRFAMSAEDLAELAASLEEEVRTGPGSQVKLGWGLHSLRACSEEEMDRALALLDDRPGRPVHIHVAEQPLEVEECLAHRGARPIEWLADHAPLGSEWCLVHATWASEDEVARICRADAVVGLCPATEANLGDGVFPLPHH
ncbi:MAG: amidohydrolase family protein, partial [Gemmatimonadetes bacterium]|nr:amidohydrolase family protein [Gemmatimonadota bacterium]